MMSFRKQLTIARVKRARLTYLGADALADLFDVVADLERHAVPGAVIEAGCALGGSAIVLARAKSRDRPLAVYDVFGMIPPPSERDGADVAERYAAIRAGASSGIGGDGYYGYEDDLLRKVQRNFERCGVEPSGNNVSFIQGLYEETLHPTEQVALAHIDADWYDSVKVCLERIDPWLVRGGRIVVDDYDSWAGCKEAVDEFLARRGDSYRTERRSRLHLVRT